MEAYELVVYRGMLNDRIFSTLTGVIDHYDKMDKIKAGEDVFSGISGLIETAQSRGFREIYGISILHFC